METISNIINEHGGSIVISPLFLQSALALLFLGADGKTAGVMRNRLDLSGVPRSVVAKKIQSLLQPYANSSILKLANGIFVNDEYKLKSSFQSVASEQFESSVQSVNFQNSHTAADLVNNWASTATNGKINRVIKSTSIDNSTSLLLANAALFHGFWQHEFSTGSIDTMKFYTDGYCIPENANAIASVFNTVNKVFLNDSIIMYGLV